MSGIEDFAALRAHMGQVSAMAERKVLSRLDRHCRAFIELSPFLVMATADRDGRADASPRGDPPGFVQALDDVTLLLPDRPGNNRADSFGNLLSAPGVGLIFMVPGIDETLRVNGRGRLVTEEERLAGMKAHGRAPRTGLLVEVDEAFFHCGKALKRARLWAPDAQVKRGAFPSLGRIVADQQNGWTAEEADARLAASYRDRLY